MPNLMAYGQAAPYMVNEIKDQLRTLKEQAEIEAKKNKRKKQEDGDAERNAVRVFSPTEKSTSAVGGMAQSGPSTSPFLNSLF